MTVSIAMRGRAPARLGGTLLLLCHLVGCGSSDPNRVQGYVEGEYVYVASPLGGTLETLSVRRGDQVSAGAPLFALDAVPEKAARDEAERKLGLLANCRRQARLVECRRLLLVVNLAAALPGVETALLTPAPPPCCPHCGGTRLIYRALAPAYPTPTAVRSDSS